MKQKLPNGGYVQILWAAFKAGTDEQVVRWDARREKVISTARRLIRADRSLRLQLRAQRFVTPPNKSDLAPIVTDAPCGPASAPTPEMPAAADPRPDVTGGLQTKAGTPERALAEESAGAISSP